MMVRAGSTETKERKLKIQLDALILAAVRKRIKALLNLIIRIKRRTGTTSSNSVRILT
jgi:hypothetical protein